jgi:ligand-binding sensor domain-containing protein/signal transduction histidine kinase
MCHVNFRTVVALLAATLLPSAIGLTGSALALDPPKAITQYTRTVWQMEDGLPQNAIRAIAQTRDGYIWLGTEEGVVRFDGVRFTVFDKANTDALKNNYVFALYEDREGSLWVGTDGGGLTRLKDERFTTLTTTDGLVNATVMSISEGRDGSLWVGTGGGLSRFKDGRFTTYTTKEGLAHDSVYSVCEGRDGSLWVGTANGLGRFKDGRFTTYTRKEGLPHNVVRAIYEDGEGNLWIGTFGGGLARLKDGKFTAYTKRHGLSNDKIWSIYEDRQKNLWIGTDSGGLNRFRDGEFATYTTKEGLSNDVVVSILEDREGSLWVGTAGGLNQFRDEKFTAHSTTEGLSHDNVRSIYEDRAGNVWVGTYGGGLNRFKDGRFTQYTTRNGLPNDIVLSIFEDRGGTLWIGTGGGGLSQFDGRRFRTYNTKNGLSSDFVRAICQDREGSLWIGTYGGGLNRLKDGKFFAYTVKQGLSSDSVLSVYEDRQGAIWIGTIGRGLNRFKDGQFTSFTTRDGLSNDTIFSIYEDQEGNLWLGTNGGGLNRFKDGRFIHYTTKEGLFNDVVYQILDDRQGNLWLSCNKGIFRVSKQDLEDVAQGKLKSVASVSYGTADGMKSIECNGGNQPAGCTTADGKLWFPTLKGSVMIDPSRLRLNTLPPPVIIEEVAVDKQPVPFGQKADLPPGRGGLEFHYTALSFLAPEKIRFKYRLEGFDEDWVAVDGRREAYYTNIPPGEYRFRVIACNSDGVWNETGASYAFSLQPHFYQTKWFYLLSAVAVALMATGLYRVRVRQLKAREKELARLVDERTRDLVEATRHLQELNRRQAEFVSGVSHELKTPLTLIRLYGETLLYGEDFTANERKGYYEIITRECERLTRLIEKVLDFSRIDRGQKQYRLQRGDLAPVVAHTVGVYSQYLARQGFSIASDLAVDLPPVRFDSEAITEAVLNLMENAAKYSGESKFIGVRLRRDNGKVVFEVEDQGIGIPANEREEIFDQFYRGHNSAGKGGYGLGLYLVKHIMDAHGGAVELDSEVGQGTRFRLVFPAPSDGQ